MAPIRIKVKAPRLVSQAELEVYSGVRSETSIALADADADADGSAHSSSPASDERSSPYATQALPGSFPLVQDPDFGSLETAPIMIDVRIDVRSIPGASPHIEKDYVVRRSSPVQEPAAPGSSDVSPGRSFPGNVSPRNSSPGKPSSVDSSIAPIPTPIQEHFSTAIAAIKRLRSVAPTVDAPSPFDTLQTAAANGIPYSDPLGAVRAAPASNKDPMEMLRKYPAISGAAHARTERNENAAVSRLMTVHNALASGTSRSSPIAPSYAPRSRRLEELFSENRPPDKLQVFDLNRELEGAAVRYFATVAPTIMDRTHRELSLVESRLSPTIASAADYRGVIMRSAADVYGQLLYSILDGSFAPKNIALYALDMTIDEVDVKRKITAMDANENASASSRAYGRLLQDLIADNDITDEPASDGALAPLERISDPLSAGSTDAATTAQTKGFSSIASIADRIVARQTRANLRTREYQLLMPRTWTTTSSLDAAFLAAVAGLSQDNLVFYTPDMHVDGNNIGLHYIPVLLPRKGTGTPCDNPFLRMHARSGTLGYFMFASSDERYAKNMTSIISTLIKNAVSYHEDIYDRGKQVDHALCKKINR